MVDKELQVLESTPKLQRRLSRLKRARESQPDAQDSLRHPLQPSNSQLTSPGANAALTTPLRSHSGVQNSPCLQGSLSPHAKAVSSQPTAPELADQHFHGQGSASAQVTGSVQKSDCREASSEQDPSCGCRQSGSKSGSGSEHEPTQAVIPASASEGRTAGSSDQSGEEGGGDDGNNNYWDEEDELEDHIKRLGSKRNNGAELAGEDSDEKTEDEKSGSVASDGGSDKDESGSEAGSGHRQRKRSKRRSASGDLAAETQRILRESAMRDCIGQGAPPEIKPLSGVLERLKSRAAAIAARAAQYHREVQPPPPADEDEDLLVVDEDNMADDALAPSVPLLMAAGGGNNSTSIPEVQGPIQRRDEDGALVAEPAIGVPVCDGDDAADEPPVLSRPAPDRSRDSGEDDLEVDKAGSEGSEPEMSVDSDSSDEEDDDVEDSPQAREQALEEARALLRDKRAQQGSHGPHYFEDEAEMSEDEGHSEDDSEGEDGDGDDHDALLEDLIGHERERKRDEKLRAAAHASWLAQQDEEDVRRLLHGVQNGFRTAQGPAFLQDEGGTLADARRRRAAANAREDDSDSPDESSDSDGEDRNEGGAVRGSPPAADCDGSDEEGAAALRRYHQQKQLREAQAEDQQPLNPDQDSRDTDLQSLLGQLAARPDRPAGLTAKSAAGPSMFSFDPAEVRKATAEPSFMGLVGMAAVKTRVGTQSSNTRSFVFGRDDSRPALSLEMEDDPVQIGETDQALLQPVGPKRSAVAWSRKSRPIGGSLLERLDPAGAAQEARSAGQERPLDFSSLFRGSLKGNSKPARKGQ